MKQKKFNLLLVSLVIVILAACSPATPALPTATPPPTATPAPTATTAPAAAPQSDDAAAAAILAQSKEAMQSVQSMRLAYTTTVEAAGQTVATTGEGVFKQPDQMYLKLEAMGQTLEFLVLGEGQVYIKLPGAESFTLNTPETQAQGGTAPDILSQTDVAQFASQVTLEGEETLAGVPVNVLSFVMDIGKYLQNDPSSATIFDPSTTTGDGKMWIDQETGYLLKMTMNLTMEIADAKVATATEMNFSDFNQPVELPTP